MVKSSAFRGTGCHICTVMTTGGVSQTLCLRGTVITFVSGLPSGPHVRPEFFPTTFTVVSQHDHRGGDHRTVV